jgi:putative acyl-CoA dehydrogenase
MPPTTFETHEVFNQSPVFEDVNLYETDAALKDAIRREGAAWAEDELSAFGAEAGSARGFEIGRLANENPPRLHRFDQKGRPADRIEFHPAYHDAMAMSFAAGLHCRGWDDAGAPDTSATTTGRHVARLGHLYMITQMEPGHVCPITMTHASVPTLRLEQSIYDQLAPKIMARTYDASFQPWHLKQSVTIGMGMTEKQGGTDVRANTTRATPTANGGPGEEYLLVGHKWFMSAPMSDAFLMLAQAPGGLSCFFIPRFLPDRSTNPLRLQRLKDKLGNHSNASSEVELLNAHGWLIGEEGRGVATIIEMVTMTRLDCAVASAGQMRLALALATHHCHHRIVFQKRLVDQPLMAQVLADMALDVEAATLLAFRLGRAFDRAATDEAEAAWRRVMTPVTKYWVCKAAPALGYEALECLGGNGYVEEGMAARLYRELPLNAIWEGSGNVMCLDLLRVLAQDADQVRQVLAEIGAAAAGDHRLGVALAEVEALIASPADREANARMLLEAMARIAAASLLRAHAPELVADAFIASRVGAAYRTTYGADRAIADARAILKRGFPFA